MLVTAYQSPQRVCGRSPSAPLELDQRRDGVPKPNPVLNIAGSRESKAPGIQKRVRTVLEILFDKGRFWPGAE